jgi:hypothetical protein
MAIRRDGDRFGLADLLLGQPDLAEQYMRALALKGQLPSYSGGEFIPTVQSLDLAEPQYDYLRRFSRFQGGARLTALAANFNYVFLGRNAVSGVRDMLAHVSQIILTNFQAAAATGFLIYIGADTLLGVGSGQSIMMDDRLVTTRSGFTIGSLQSGTNVSSGLFGLLEVMVPAASSLVLDLDYILSNTYSAAAFPNVLISQTNAQNVDTRTTFIWRERVALTTEVR